MTLALVSVGSIALHSLGAGLYALQDRLCPPNACPVLVSFEPNVYAAFADLSTATLTGTQVFQLLLTLIVLSAIGFWTAGWFVTAFNSKGALDQPLYGWLAEIATADKENEAVLAYVVSDIEEGGVVLGYEGVVKNLSVTADRDIASILLASCETFYLKMDKKGVSRHKVLRAAPIPQIYLDRANIRNIAFEKVRFEL